MDIKSGNGYPSGTLSNFTSHGFEIDGITCASMEGFLQALKFKDANMQVEICKLTGGGAKRSGAKKNWQKTQTLWWKGSAIKRDSDEYQALLDKAFMAKFRQNAKARKALLSTQKANLSHSIGRSKSNETVLTKKEYCSRLMRIRDEMLLENYVDLS